MIKSAQFHLIMRVERSSVKRFSTSASFVYYSLTPVWDQLSNIFAFEKNRNYANVILRRNRFTKKSKSKNIVTLSLQRNCAKAQPIWNRS